MHRLTGSCSYIPTAYITHDIQRLTNSTKQLDGYPMSPDLEICLKFCVHVCVCAPFSLMF